VPNMLDWFVSRGSCEFEERAGEGHQVVDAQGVRQPESGISPEQSMQGEHRPVSFVARGFV